MFSNMVSQWSFPRTEVSVSEYQLDALRFRCERIGTRSGVGNSAPGVELLQRHPQLLIGEQL